MCGYEHFDFDSVEPLAGVSVLQTPFACVANHTGPVTGNAPTDLDFGAFQGKRPLPPFPDDIETGLRVARLSRRVWIRYQRLMQFGPLCNLDQERATRWSASEGCLAAGSWSPSARVRSRAPPGTPWGRGARSPCRIWSRRDRFRAAHRVAAPRPWR